MVQREEAQGDKMEDKWIERKLVEWESGSIYCEDREKGLIIKHLLERIKKLEGGKEE